MFFFLFYLKKEQNILSFKKTDLKKKQVGWVLLKKKTGFSQPWLIHLNNFGIASVLLEATDHVIPTYFELILNAAATTRPA